MVAPADDPRPVDWKLQATGSDKIYQAAGDQFVFERPPARTPAAVTNTLPRDTAAFTGRAGEIERIMATVARAAEGDDIIPVHAIDGMPGVGKTTLAVHAAHLLAAQFPAGQMFLDLHAHTVDRNPVDPADALVALLSADGVPPARIPPGLDARAAQWRTRMAGKRALLIIDNAAGHAQVEPLLPGAAGCLVLITSRRRLTGLGARHATVTLTLDTLTENDAAELFTRLAHRHLADTESQAAAELVRLCGYLPLAISLLAARLRPEPGWTVAGLLADLADTQDRLADMRAEDLAVAAALDLSYRDLPAARQAYLRRLGLHPGTDVDTYAGAALGGVTLAESRGHLEGLYHDHLLDQPVRGRYRMHDLVRIYARNLAEADPAPDRTQAVDRVVDYYRYTASVANRYVDTHVSTQFAQPPHTDTAVPTLSCPEQASSWLGTEIGNLFACVAHARIYGLHPAVVGFSESLAAYLRRTGPWPQAIELHRAAVLAARTCRDDTARAHALQSLGIVLARTGDNETADSVLQEALATYRDLGDHRGKADVVNELGMICRVTGRLPAAAGFIRQALAIYQDLGNRLGQARALNNLGVVCWLTDDCTGAANAFQTALSIYRDHNEPFGQADALLRLGMVYRMTDNYPAATNVLHEALAICHVLGDRLGQANAIFGLGVIQRLTGDYADAACALRQALASYQDLGDRMDEANSLKQLGIVHRETGNLDAAVEASQRALAIYTELGDRIGQADALYNLGSALRLTGSLTAAAEALRAAMGIYVELGSRIGQAEVLNFTGDLLLQRGDPAQAADLYQRARRLAREVHSAREEAHALEGAAHCALRQHDTGGAIENLRQAWQTYGQINAPEAERIAAELAELTSTAPNAA